MICENIIFRSFIRGLIFIISLSLSHGQDWGGTNGYNQLIDELSSPPTISHQSVLIISAADTNWKYKKGISEASTPINLWRELDFVEDEEWIQGQTPIGYGDEDDNTILDDMRGSDFEFSEAYTSVYFRKKIHCRERKYSS